MENPQVNLLLATLAKLPRIGEVFHISFEEEKYTIHRLDHNDGEEFPSLQAATEYVLSQIDPGFWSIVEKLELESRRLELELV